VSENETRETVVIPVPLLAPFMLPLNAQSVQEVWDTFVKPEQDAGTPQSIEMRGLMAILRAVYEGLSDAEVRR
jgi:hypothetical protein